MAEAKRPSFDDLMKQIEEFERTIKELAENVRNLRQKLLANKEKYGEDISAWPKEAK